MTMLNETFVSGGHTVPLSVFLPVPSHKCPAVLILHGSFGLLPAYRADIISFANALVSAGFAAVMPHYLDATTPVTLPGEGVLKLIPQLRPAWRQACSDALATMAQDSRLDANRLGVLGFSLGGNLALSLAMDPPAGTRIKCVVDFFGPTQWLEGHWSKLPPILICHGADDLLVVPGQSDFLVAQLEKAGRKSGAGYEFQSYPGQGHGFKEPALTKSRDAAVDFVKRTL